MWALIAYLGLSVLVLGPSELAGVYFLNRRWRILRSGVYLLPVFIFTVKKFSTNTHRQMTPGKKEDIVRDDTAPLVEGQVRAVRIIHASSENAHYWVKDPTEKKYGMRQDHYNDLPKEERDHRSSENDSLESSITTEIIAFTDFNLSCEKKDDGSLDESLFDFVENVGSIERAGRRLDGTVRGALQELLAPITARHATEVKAFIEQLIKDRLELLVGEKFDRNDPEKVVEKKWGINISAFQIEEINPGKTVNSARADEAASISLKAKAIREGEAAAAVTRVNAEAEAFQEMTVGKAKAEAFTLMASALKTPEGILAAQLETAKTVLAKSGTIVLSGTNGDPAGIIGSMATVAKAVVSNKP